MTPRVAILDYGCGNLASVANAVRKVGGEPEIIGHGYGLDGCRHLILPGQGHFQTIAARHPDDWSWLHQWRASNRPILGICLGMQLMCEGSEEAPGVRGLGWLPFQVSRLAAQRLPHIGWNTVAGRDYYFCHSYGIGWLPHDRAGFPNDAPIANLCEYDGAFFLAEYRSGVLWAVQFHPEKSGQAGLSLLAEFLNL